MKYLSEYQKIANRSITFTIFVIKIKKFFIGKIDAILAVIVVIMMHFLGKIDIYENIGYKIFLARNNIHIKFLSRVEQVHLVMKTVSEKKHLLADNERLKEENAILLARIKMMQEVKQEKEVLGSILEVIVDSDEQRFEGTRIISREKTAQGTKLLIQLKSTSASHVGDLVMSNHCLIGRIEEIHENFAVVSSLESDNFRITAVSERSGFRSIVRGGNNILTEKFEIKDAVMPGDKLFVANADDGLSSQILIGETEQYGDTIRVNPAANISRTKFAIIVLKKKIPSTDLEIWNN